MSTAVAASSGRGIPRPPRQLAPSGVIAMTIFVFTEIMLFAGFISGFVIVKAGSPGAWPPPGQPRLPAEETAINTLALLASGALLVLANLAFRRQQRRKTRDLLLAAMLLAGFFVVFQGAEWVALLGQGLTLTSSTMGSFFYTIVGLHALHAVVAIGLLIDAYVRFLRGRLTGPRFWTIQVFWYFVVGIWPLIYTKVYL